MSIASKFTEEELVVIFEASRLALADAETFDYLVDELDITDEDMSKLRSKLKDTMKR